MADTNYNVSILVKLVDKMSLPAKAAAENLKGLDTVIKKIDLSKFGGAANRRIKLFPEIEKEIPRLTIFKNKLNDIFKKVDIKPFLASLDKGGREVKKFGRDLSGDVTLPILALTGLTIKSAIDFDRLRESLGQYSGAFDTIKTASMKTGVAIEDLSAIFLDAKKSGFVSLNSLKDLGTKGIPVIEQLAKRFGVSTEDIEHMAAAGIISLDDLNEAMGTISKGWNKDTMSLSRSFDILKSTIAVSFADIGEDIAKTIDLKGIFISLTESIKKLATWFHGLSDSQKKTIVTILGIAAAMGPAVLITGKLMEYFSVLGTVVGKLWGGLIKLEVVFKKVGHFISILAPHLKTMFLFIADGLKSIATALMANPVMLIIAGVVALAAAVYLVWKYWDDIVKVIGKAIEGVSKFFGMGSNDDIRKNAALQMERQRAIQTVRLPVSNNINGMKNENSSEVIIKVQSDKGTTSTIEGIKNTKGSSNVKVSNKTQLGRVAPI